MAKKGRPFTRRQRSRMLRAARLEQLRSEKRQRRFVRWLEESGKRIDEAMRGIR